jgi:hypothetical protein
MHRTRAGLAIVHQRAAAEVSAGLHEVDAVGDRHREACSSMFRGGLIVAG